MPKLKWELLTKKRGSSTQGVPPGKEDLAWVTNTVTLISGEHDAVLVDTFLSEQQSKELLDWIVASGKNLTTIYVTHAHGDHFFGLKLLLDRFPNAKAIATASVVAAINNQIAPEFIKSFWEPRFPGQLPSTFVAPEVLDGDTFYLEGNELKVVELGHTDTSHTTALHVPSIGLVISGDGVYNNTHLYLAECDEAARAGWLHALDIIEALEPKAVVTGHGVLDPDSSPRHIAETRQYLQDFAATIPVTNTAIEFYEKMLSLYPSRVNPGSLWAAAKAMKPS
ncbi:MBL fold metallo-hydrolase [Rhizobium mayense]|uniref:MBL fold metallo-hydrolase n=1 Tax=Rhizobium mayense TaxID=1312184 RepID=A0ABT7JX12_9HYPH|nr:MBL fold metallo-hydrolase [Rhizobium mayense]MDL2400295.1 MBL fold metallo-hydrolase [Rhizobium mayense]